MNNHCPICDSTHLDTIGNSHTCKDCDTQFYMEESNEPNKTTE